ncbi:MAG: phosphate transport system substrate-binding protein [Frankiales bacterium]|nr:phosphate transport system substrate-binding protein [Frankiales bacterium]
MKNRLHHATVGLSAAAVAVLALSGCGSDNAASAGGQPSAKANCATGSIMASGSSAQANAMSEWVKGYTASCSGATINYQAVGSGAGIQAFIQGSTAFAGSDSALKDEEHGPADARCKSGKAIDLPMVAGPIAVAYNLPGVDSLTLTPSLIAKIFSGKVTTWDDPAIAAVNSGAKLPSKAIQSFHRSDSSGTSDNFTKYLTAAAGSDWTYDHAKEWKAPGGQGAKGSDGVTTSVKQTEGGVAYVEYSFAKNASLGVAKVDNGAGAVELTPDAVGKAVEAATVVGAGNDLALKLDYTTKVPGAYPIALVTYEITCEKGLSSDQLAVVKSFLAYTAGDGQQTLTDLGYAPIPASLQAKVTAAIAALS